MAKRSSTHEHSFTLIELLVVMLVIGVLVAIALPTFIGQRGKGQDAATKSDARNLLSQVDACAADETKRFVDCNHAAMVTQATGLELGQEDGQAEVTEASLTGYTVVGHSPTGNDFTIEREGNTVTRTCDTPGKGGCPADGTW